MNDNLNHKQLFGKILGEVYRLQLAVAPDICPVDAGTVYALTKGLESEIDNQIESIGWNSQEQMNVVCEVLDRYFLSPEKLSALKGFYDIERELSSRGVDRVDAIRIITYLKADGRFEEVIEKFDSTGSPGECRKFEIY